MDKRVIFAVAGSGKTTCVVDSLSLEKRSLILTYTTNNIENLRRKVIEKFGFIPENISIISFYSFIYTFCYKPVLLPEVGAKGINYEPNNRRGIRKSQREYYVSSSNRLYSNRISLLINESKFLSNVLRRLEKYYDQLIFDEIQDVSGHDFNLLKSICGADISILFVGDYYQYTYATSRDGTVRRNLHSDYDAYRAEFELMGLVVDQESLIKSYRCTETVCEYVTSNLGIHIESTTNRSSRVELLADRLKIESVVANDSIIKLFYSNQDKYDCASRNWGDCKGEDRYNDICVVMNDTTIRKLRSGNLQDLSPLTRNKLYVAMTRARRDVYLIDQSDLDYCKA